MTTDEMIKNDLLTRTLSASEVADKYNVSVAYVNLINSKIGKTNAEFYKDFRTELDTMIIPLILEEADAIEIYADGKQVGILCISDGYYIDCLYIEPKYRRRGLARSAALEHCFPGMKLHIINNNIPAQKFWHSIFTLIPLASNSVDTLYEIVGVLQ